MDIKKKMPPQLTAPQLIVAGFLGIILIGGFILSSPICSADGTWTPLADAMFTATTSACVTGLTTVTTAYHWSLAGKIVILILIELGGMGVITVFAAFLMLVGRKLMLRESILIRDQYNLESFQGMGDLIKRVFRWTLGLEAIGAVGYAFYFIPNYGPLRGIWYSIFHAVSAFCNAGIDLVGDSSFVPLVSNPIINITTMFLIISGGIGFVVLWDIEDVIKKTIKKEYKASRFFHRISLHSKLALSITGILLVGGFVLILIFEWNNPDTIGSMSVFEKLQAAFFQSVTTRTAGFASIPQENFRDQTSVLNLLLMFVGGSPMGTAGGVKTTTIGIIILTVFAQVRGTKDTEVFQRKISSENIRTALAVAVWSVTVHVIVIIALLIAVDGTFLETIFEAVSALGTVGLTMGLTGKLGLAGKIIIMIAMYLGRVGPITLAIAFAMKQRNGMKNREYPEKRIIIG